MPLDRSDIDTDQIIPSDWLKRVERTGFDKGLFSEWRDDPDFVMNQEQYSGANILVGGPNFGTGSSREHAAMEPRFRGCHAVFAKSFARIHETNLKKQGVLALTFDDPNFWDQIGEGDTISITGLSELAPGKKVDCVLHKVDGESIEFKTNQTLSADQIEWFHAGSALNLIRQQTAG